MLSKIKKLLSNITPMQFATICVVMAIAADYGMDKLFDLGALQ